MKKDSRLNTFSNLANRKKVPKLITISINRYFQELNILLPNKEERKPFSIPPWTQKLILKLFVKPQ